MEIFIGWDDTEAVAYHVLAHSIIRRASGPVKITPLKKSQLKSRYTRERGPLESTDFSLTRFLTPILSGENGSERSLYLDCDMLCLEDIYKLPWDYSCDVAVVQHSYNPKGESKMGGLTQTRYPRKNWSSLMAFNNASCEGLTYPYVNHASPLDLHRLRWASSIGSIPKEWNWLVGEYPENPEAKILHYTLGGPWLDTPEIPAYEITESERLWTEEYNSMIGR